MVTILGPLSVALRFRPAYRFRPDSELRPHIATSVPPVEDYRLRAAQFWWTRSNPGKEGSDYLCVFSSRVSNRLKSACVFVMVVWLLQTRCLGKVNQAYRSWCVRSVYSSLREHSSKYRWLDRRAYSPSVSPPPPLSQRHTYNPSPPPPAPASPDTHIHTLMHHMHTCTHTHTHARARARARARAC